MRSPLNRAVALLNLGLVLVWPAVTQARGSSDCEFAGSRIQNSSSHEFLIFDATLYRDKPDLSVLGIKPLKVIDRGFLQQSDRGDAPDKDLIKALVAKLPKDAARTVVIDIEHWPVTGEATTVLDSISKLHAVIAAFKTYAPEKAFGFYGLLPIRDYWRALQGPGNAKYQQWQAENDRLVPLAVDVDALFPSIYTFYEDQIGWIKYAEAQVCEARRLSNRPVFPFLWPEYHDSNRTLRGIYLDARFWRVQLETMRNTADGVVIWGGYDLQRNRPRDWDENAAWWQQTKQFANELRSKPVTR
jgi:glycosyl hydrolase family 56 (putative hyaluronidase)